MASPLNNYNYKDPGVLRFKKTNLYYTEDPYLLYQDPTWLGFKLFFNFDQADSKLFGLTESYTNTAYSYLLRIGDKARAGYMEKFVKHIYEINNKTPWFFQTITGLSEAWKRGYQDENFKPLLPNDRKIEIGCLESIDLRISALMDLYRKSCFDWYHRREIVPWNLRNFDVLIYVYEIREINRTGKPSPSGMLDLTRLAGIPDINQKQQSENKRLLGEDPYGSDDSKSPLKQLIDKGKSIIEGVKADPIQGIKSALNPNTAGNEASNTPNTNINRFLFKFKYCEFLPDESGAVLEKVASFSGGEGEAAQQKIVFSYRDVEEINLYNIYSEDQYVQDKIIQLFDQAAIDDPNLVFANENGSFRTNNLKERPSYGLESVLNEAGYGVLTPFASLAGDKLERLISSYAGKLLMGNIYGFSPLNAAGAVSGVLSGDPTQVLAGAQNLVGQIAGSKSEKNRTNDVESIGPIDKGSSQFNNTNDVTSIGGRRAVDGSSLSNNTKDVGSLGNTYTPGPSITNKTIDVDSLGSTYDPGLSPSNNTNDVDSLGPIERGQSPTNKTNDVGSLGTNDPGQSPSNATKDVSSLGSIAKGDSPINKTNDVGSLGNNDPGQSPSNATKDVGSLGTNDPGQSPSNATKDVGSLGNTFG
jgi:hypothetical protein